MRAVEVSDRDGRLDLLGVGTARTYPSVPLRKSRSVWSTEVRIHKTQVRKPEIPVLSHDPLPNVVIRGGGTTRPHLKAWADVLRGEIPLAMLGRPALAYAWQKTPREAGVIT